MLQGGKLEEYTLIKRKIIRVHAPQGPRALGGHSRRGKAWGSGPHRFYEQSEVRTDSLQVVFMHD